MTVYQVSNGDLQFGDSISLNWNSYVIMNGVVCDSVAFSVRRNGPSIFVSEIWFVNFPCPSRAIATRKCNYHTRQVTLPMWRNSSNGNVIINDGCMPTYVCVVMCPVRVLDCVVVKQHGEIAKQYVNNE